MKYNDNTNVNRIASFNPLAWGILFFTFWLSLRTISQLQTLQEILSWASLGLSGILWLSILIPPLADIFDKPRAKTVFLPLIFFVSITGYTFSWVGSLPGMEGFARDLSFILGFLWIVAYLLVLVRSTTRVIGILASSTFVGFGIYHLIDSQIVGGAALLVLGIVLLVIATKRPRIWRHFPSG